MHKTQNNLSSNTKKVAIALMNERLADVLDLKALTKQAHWNVKGPHFIGLHEMFDGFAATLDGHADIIAERIVAIGGTALGTTQMVVKSSMLAAYPTDIYAGRDHVEALVTRYGAAANAARKSIDELDEKGEADAADILTALSRDLDKALWFLEAHLQADN